MYTREGFQKELILIDISRTWPIKFTTIMFAVYDTNDVTLFAMMIHVLWRTDTVSPDRDLHARPN